MKKSLLALAALAACAGAYADVTISGTIATGFKATRDSFGADASGLGVDTSAITFAANEDLGNGQKVEASIGFDGVTRSAANGGDVTLTYTNNAFGRIQLGTVKDGDVFSAIAYGGANLITFDGKLNQIETSSDFFSYAAPIGPVIFVFKHTEAGNSITNAAGIGGLGLGTGTQGPTVNTTQGTNTVALVYKTNALSLVGAYRSYNNRNDSGNFSDVNSFTKSDVVHIEGGYDFGAIKIGAGADHVNAAWGVTQDNFIAGFSIPAGAWTFGAAWESSKVDGVSSAALTAFAPIYPAPIGSLVAAGTKKLLSQTEGTASGATFGAQYNFSKRTNVALRYATWTRSGYEQLEAYKLAAAAGNPAAAAQLGYKQNETSTDILLTHNF